MPLNTTISVLGNANDDIPETHTPTTLTPITNAAKKLITVQLAVAGIDNATVATALVNLKNQLQTELDNEIYPNVLKLDTTGDIDINATVRNIDRGRDVAGTFEPGNEVYEVEVLIEW